LVGLVGSRDRSPEEEKRARWRNVAKATIRQRERKKSSANGEGNRYDSADVDISGIDHADRQPCIACILHTRAITISERKGMRGRRFDWSTDQRLNSRGNMFPGEAGGALRHEKSH
jgi:hypothetical protein